MSGDVRRIATPSQTVGPFFHFALCKEPVNRMAGQLAGEPIRLVVGVTDGDGRPVSDALVELSHAGAFGRMPTNDDGTCEFETVRPAFDEATSAGRRAHHIDVCLFARGLLRHLHTRIYFAGDPSIDGDPTLAVIPEDRRVTLLATRDAEIDGRWLFDLRLQGPQETVFFDA